VPDILKSLFESIAVSAKTTAMVSLGCATALAFLVFGSDNVLKSLGLMEFRADYRLWLGLLLIFSTVSLGIHVVVFVWEKASRAIRRQLVIRGRRRGLHSLTEPEKKILRGFIVLETKTQGLA